MIYLNGGWLSSLVLFVTLFQAKETQAYGPEITFSNIDKVWAKRITGKNIVVAVVDDGVNYGHVDLKNNYDQSISYDFAQNDSYPMPQNKLFHGTKCAGLIASRKSGTCRTGIAYDAKLAGLRLFGLKLPKKEQKAAALKYKRNKIDIYSNSWGPSDNGYSIKGPSIVESKALENGTKYGRNGWGNIFVFSSGNGGLFGDSCAFDGYTNNIHTISIGSSSKDGVPKYAEPCSSIMATAYGDYMKTCSGPGTTSCSNDFEKTSGAAAAASGIIALLLDAADNKLTWRDVQHLIVRTSSPRKANLDRKSWSVNGAGLLVHPYVGFGVLDAEKLVDVAQKNWKLVPSQRSCAVVVVADSSNKLTLPGQKEFTISMKKTSSCSNIKAIEHVQVELSLFASSRATIEMYLTSPQGTKSQILYPRIYDALSPAKRYDGLVVTSLHFWGENSGGKWKVLFKSAESLRFLGAFNSKGTLNYLKLTFYGTGEDPLLETPLPQGTITCGDKKFWKGYGSVCCGTKWLYNPSDEKCCSNSQEIVARQNPKCGSTPYDECAQICCNGMIQNKFKNGALMSCCDKTAYDKETQICCESKSYQKSTCDYNSRLRGYFFKDVRCTRWGARPFFSDRPCRTRPITTVQASTTAAPAPSPTTEVWFANVIADDIVTVYADGVEIGKSTRWNLAEQFQMPAATTMVAMKAKNTGNAYGLKASFNGAELATDTERWRCSGKWASNWMKPSFDDSKWEPPRVVNYYGDIEEIERRNMVHPDAKWIWTNSWGDKVVYCRAKLHVCKDKSLCVKQIDCVSGMSKSDQRNYCAKTCGFC